MTIFKANLFNTPPMKYAGISRTSTRIGDSQMKLWNMQLRMMIAQYQCQSETSAEFAREVADLLGLVQRIQ